MKCLSIKQLISALIISLVISFIFPSEAKALYDPLSRPNNMFGVHILFTTELEKAAKLVNSSGGEWGYVTVPIQITDHDLEKWQTFMDECKRFKLIPILRISTEPDPNNTHVWRIPNDYDILDMANFLNSLNWPVENRYIIAYNETNRYDEWGGQPPDPEKYADILEYTIDAFKTKNENFFIIMGGLDNAAPNQPDQYLNSFVYLSRIADYKSELFNNIDGFSSHSYPNPNFAQPPHERVMGVSTYLHEYEFIHRYTDEKKPVFITETGWNAEALSEDTIAEYYDYTFKNLWQKNADKIVAVTPFLLESHGGFDKFSFYKEGKPTKYHDAVVKLPKSKGEPVLTDTAETLAKTDEVYVLDMKSAEEIKTSIPKLHPLLKFYFKSILGIFP